MNDTVLVAIISLIGTFAGSFSGMNLVKWRINQLEKKVDKHNNFAERIPVIEKDLKTVWHEIGEIKEEMKN